MCPAHRESDLEHLFPISCLSTRLGARSGESAASEAVTCTFAPKPDEICALIVGSIGLPRPEARLRTGRPRGASGFTNLDRPPKTGPKPPEPGFWEGEVNASRHATGLDDRRRFARQAGLVAAPGRAPIWPKSVHGGRREAPIVGGMTHPCRGVPRTNKLRVSRPDHCHRHQRESH